MRKGKETLDIENSNENDESENNEKDEETVILDDQFNTICGCLKCSFSSSGSIGFCQTFY